MTVLCPKCKSGELSFVRKSSEYQMYEDESIILCVLIPPYPSDTDVLQCEDCDWKGPAIIYADSFHRLKRRSR